MSVLDSKVPEGPLADKWVNHKNHINLIKAWRLLGDDGIFPNLVLTIDKNTNLSSIIHENIKNFNLNIVIKDNLKRNDVLDLYAKAGVLIFPSYIESYGLPLVEASYFNIPIIASELDYVRDILDPVETFDPCSEKSIYRAVKRYLKIKDKKTEIVNATQFIHDVISFE